jgi:hypothetical protein
MTEAEWRTCSEPLKMLRGLSRDPGARKLRLYACGCCRRIWFMVPDERSRRAVEAAERNADGEIDAAALRGAASLAEAAAEAAELVQVVGWHAARTAAEAAGPGDREAAEWAGSMADDGAVLRCVLGNPFRPEPVVDPGCLAWNGGTVPKLAEAIYRDRAFRRLPILADALEDAGCADAEILAHCRAGGLHARGCWVLDLLTGRG